MNRKARLERIEELAARTPDAGRTCVCPFPPATKDWDTDEGVDELVHQFTRPCLKCGRTRWDESMLANFEKAYGGADAI